MSTRRPQEPRVLDRLPGEEDLSRLYQQAAEDQPPLTLDATILTAARHATRSGTRRLYPVVSRRWTVPVALAAALVLSIGILQVRLSSPPPPGPSTVTALSEWMSTQSGTPPVPEAPEPHTPQSQWLSPLAPAREAPTTISPRAVRRQEDDGRAPMSAVVPLPMNEGQAYIQQMLGAAQMNGGLDHEEVIAAAKRRLEALGLKSQFPHGDRGNARSANERGRQYMQNRQFAEAVQAFQEASRADPADMEIMNNLGEAYLQRGDVRAAEEALLRALVFVPDRSRAWADLGQLYARQKKVSASVACFANAYRFAADKDSIRALLQHLAKEGTENEQEAARQALQLQLVRGDAALSKTGDAYGKEQQDPPAGHSGAQRK